MPLFLLDLQPLPDDPPEYVSPGGESEAVDYILGNGAYWLDAPGAFEWFVGQFKVAVDELEKRVRAEENALKLRRLMGH
ncbi:MAG: hypothetical protein DMF66_07485 [Acidobacteria bacterium]|nr:MAG: hypothetical protein DMF66_07485 [Acidobacteriota bacterium]